MTLTTTIGGATSDSYATLAEYDAYAAKMGWSGSIGDEANLRRATMYLDRQYNWVGHKVAQTQALVWPRYTTILVDGWSVSSETIPQAIKDAQCELAYLISQGATPFATVAGGAVLTERVKAGPVESETTYAGARETPRYVAIEGLVRPYVLAINRVVRG